MNDINKLVKDNLPLVHACAKRFKNRGVEYEDLYQAGCLGLLKAARGYNADLGFVFSTYAVPAVLGEIKRIFRDGGAIKVSRSLKERSREIWLQKEKLESELSRDVTVNELSTHLNMEPAEVSELLLVFQPVISLTQSDDENEKQVDIPVENQERTDNIIVLKDCINDLEEGDRKIISLRYFQARTQSDVAKALGLSQVQVSRREKVILTRIREKMSV